MCGIVGMISLPDGSQATQEQLLKRMMDSIEHRGPDAEGLWIEDSGNEANKNVALGHRRLSIIDLDSGAQPMQSADGRYVIVFNGEIYNFKDLQAELGEECSFKTDSDTEVLLHLYARHGEDMVKHLRGMFAFAIYDRKEQSLFAARDHLGQKPFYYHQDGDKFYFASEIKALLEADPALRVMDKQALYEYLSIRIISPPRSMFEGIKKLAPGHKLSFQGQELKIERYWNLSYAPKFVGSFDQAVDELDKRFEESVRYHMVSDVPVGSFLSGGMDSSLIVAKMSALQKDPISTFSGDVPYEQYSELPYAKLVSDKFNTKHHALTINPSLMRHLAHQIWHLDEPSDPLSLCVYHLAKLVREHVKVVLGGEGGDELFAGYDRYYGNMYVSYIAMLPGPVRKGILEPLLRLLPEGFWYRSISHKLRWMLQMANYEGAERYSKSLGYFYFSDKYRESLYTPQFRKSTAGFDPEASIKQYFNTDNASHPLDCMLHSDSMVRMVDHPVMVSDRMTMAHGLEARAPFLDHKLAEFCASLPPEYKIRGKRLRVIEKALALKHLPAELFDRKKQGFSSALPYLLADEFKLLYKIALSDSRLVEEGILQRDFIGSLLEEHLSKKADHGNRLWLLCNAELWYRMYIDGIGVEGVNELLLAGID